MTRFVEQVPVAEAVTVAQLRRIVDDVAALVPLPVTADRAELAGLGETTIAWLVEQLGLAHLVRRRRAHPQGRTNPPLPAGYDAVDPRFVDELVRFPLTDAELAQLREQMIDGVRLDDRARRRRARREQLRTQHCSACGR